MACQALVFNIPELLEHILSHVDWRTLLLAQRVSHHWHEIIRGSIALQIMLALQPQRKQEVWAVQKSTMSMFVGAHKIDTLATYEQASNEVTIERAKPTHAMRMLAEGGLNNPLDPDFGTAFLFKWHFIPSVLLEDDAWSSWRRMQCMQPPVKYILACTTVYYRDTLMFRRMLGHRSNEHIRNDNGVTMGEVVDLIKRWKATAPPGIDWQQELFSLTAVGVIAEDSFFTRLVGRTA